MPISASGAAIVGVASTSPMVVPSALNTSTPIVATFGPPGPPGAAGGFTYAQASPAATWTIATNLGRYPSSVLIMIGTQLVDADIDLPDVNTVVITFATPQSGRAQII